MAKSVAQLTEQMHRIQQQIEVAKSKEVAGVVARIQEAISHYGLTAEQLFPAVGERRRKSSPKAAKGRGLGPTRDVASPAAKKAKSKMAGVKLPAKYGDDKGNSWTGRGTTPRWLADATAGGKTKEDFALKS